MAVTLKQIAEEAHVSQMTVSRILNRKDAGQVSPEVAARVRSVAAQLNYQPNTAARVLRGSSENVIEEQRILSFLLPYQNYFETENKEQIEHTMYLFSCVLQIAAEMNVRVETVPVSRCNSPVIPEWTWLKHLDGNSKILAFGTWYMPLLIILGQRGCRIAHMSGEVFWRDVYARYTRDWVLFTLMTVDGAQKMTDSLLQQGCREIAALTPSLTEPNEPLIMGYEQALTTANIAYRNMILTDAAEKGLAALSAQIAAAYHEKPFDGALLDLPDGLKFDYTQSLNANLGIPESVRVISKYDNNHCAQFNPPVPAVRYPYKTIIRDAIGQLFEKIFHPGEKFYSGEIVKHESIR